MSSSRIALLWIVLAVLIAASAGAVAFIVGSHPTKEKDNAFTAALDDYYNSRPDCLWPDSIKFPQSAESSNADLQQGFSALVDAGLLQPVSAASPRRSRHAAPETELELSDMGHANWTADAARAGYGNFCYGHPQVVSIQAYKRVHFASEKQYSVDFRETVLLPGWATTPQVQKAFPKVASASAGQTATATLVKNNDQWQVQGVATPDHPVE
jgi:hypothetical protein